jgi:protein SCO1/2
VCPALTRHLATAVDSARDVLGEDSFQVLTIGFDSARDTPDAMRVFAREQSISDPHWAFLSASQQNLDRLVENIGFIYYPSPRGFDHINQVTVVDREGVIYRQIYGAAFDLPWLVEPLKDLVFNRPQSAGHFVAGMVDRVRLFCTVYDPATGRYRFDYSLFVQIAIGALAILSIAGWLLLEARRSRRRKRSGV